MKFYNMIRKHEKKKTLSLQEELKKENSRKQKIAHVKLSESQ